MIAENPCSFPVRLGVVALFFGLCLAGSSSARAQLNLKAPAKAEFISAASALEAGKSFMLGVHYTMDPDWHIYWRNSGDSGYATSATLSLPPGFTTSALQWPAPRRFTVPDEIVYGYDGDVVLFYLVTPPATLTAGPFKFHVKTSWLVCKSGVGGLCIPGKAALDLELPAGKSADSPAATLLYKAADAVPAMMGAPPSLVNQLPISASADQATNVNFDADAKQLDAARLAAEPDLFGFYAVFPDDFEATHAHVTAAQTGVHISLPIKPRPQVHAQNYNISGVLVLPVTGGALREEFPIEVVVGSGKASALPIAASTATPSETAPKTPLTFHYTSVNQNSTSLWVNLLFAFLGGMLLNIMPCVLPVISIKILGFVRQSTENPARVRVLGLVYVAGILASFIAMALLVIALKAGGNQVGWGFQFQEPRFVIVMAAIITAMALSLFNVFEIEPPQAAGQLAASRAREGAAGAFWSGVLTTALATPCVAPMLAPAVGYAFGQPYAIIFLFFVVIGAGLATPYLLLAFFPSLLRWMPKPGAWMETFKQTMGFVLLATVIYLLWVLTSLASPDVMGWTLAFLLTVGVACWILGKAFTARTNGKRRFGTVVALSLCLAGYYAFGEVPLQISDTRAAEAAAIEKANPTAQAPSASGTIAWQPFTPEKADALARHGQPVFVDFTADWCITCKANEKRVLARDSVAQLFQKYNVATLKADYTRRDDRLSQVLSAFGSSGVPLYVVFPAGKPDAPVVLPTWLTEQAITDVLAQKGHAGRIQIRG